MCVVNAPLLFKRQTHRNSPCFLRPVASISLHIYWTRERKPCEQRLITKPSESASQDALPSSYGTFKLQKPQALRKSHCPSRQSLPRHKRCPQSLRSGRFQSTYDCIWKTSPCNKGENTTRSLPRGGGTEADDQVPPIPVHSPPKKSYKDRWWEGFKPRLLTSEPGVLLEHWILNPGS